MSTWLFRSTEQFSSATSSAPKFANCSCSWMLVGNLSLELKQIFRKICTRVVVFQIFKFYLIERSVASLNLSPRSSYCKASFSCGRLHSTSRLLMSFTSSTRTASFRQETISSSSRRIFPIWSAIHFNLYRCLLVAFEIKFVIIERGIVGTILEKIVAYFIVAE